MPRTTHREISARGVMASGWRVGLGNGHGEEGEGRRGTRERDSGGTRWSACEICRASGFWLITCCHCGMRWSCTVLYSAVQVPHVPHVPLTVRGNVSPLNGLACVWDRANAEQGGSDGVMGSQGNAGRALVPAAVPALYPLWYPRRYPAAEPVYLLLIFHTSHHRELALALTEIDTH